MFVLVPALVPLPPAASGDPTSSTSVAEPDAPGDHLRGHELRHRADDALGRGADAAPGPIRLRLYVQALPLLLLVVIVVFFTQEVLQDRALTFRGR